MAEKKNRTVSNMGLIGALLIVLLHVKPIPNTCFQSLLVDFVYSKSGFPGTAVPMFFGISGYFLNSVVMKSVPDNCVVEGNPARIVRKNGIRINERL